MAKIQVHNINKDAVGEVELEAAVFETEVNEDLLYDVVKAQLASKRQGTAAVKNRALVQGSSKKIVKQKGSGGARHGNRRAPIFVGGGQAHGPKPRSYAYRPTRKMRLGALKSALSHKLQIGKLVILDNYSLDEIKTKLTAEMFKKFEAKSAIVVDAADNFNLRMSLRNMPKHGFLPPEGVNVYDILRAEYLFVTQDALAPLQDRFSRARATAEAAE